MSIVLTKGSTLDLSKEKPGLTKVLVGFGWDSAEEGKEIDLDVLAFLTDGTKIVDEKALVFFNNLVSGDGSAVHSGDNLTGEGDGDDETITFDLAKVAEAVTAVDLVVYAYSGQKFTEVKNVVARIVDASDNSELATFSAQDLGDVTGVKIGRLVRSGTEWSFVALSEVITGDLATLTASYGV